jgi:hypothetical protein
MRSATWISPAVASDVKADLSGSESQEDIEKIENPLAASQHYFTPEQLDKFKSDPSYHLEFRKKMENVMNNSTDVFVADSEMNKAARKMMEAEMERRLGPGNEELKQKLIPTWAPGMYQRGS